MKDIQEKKDKAIADAAISRLREDRKKRLD